MANITGITYKGFPRKASKYGSGTVQAYTQTRAEGDARAAANNWSFTTSTASLNWLSSSDISDKAIGGRYYPKETNIETAYYNNGVWNCFWEASQDYYQLETLINFTLPSGVNANNIGSATLTISTQDGNQALLNTVKFYVCAPNSSSSNAPTEYIQQDNSLIYSSKATFYGSDTSNDTYNINITNQLKQCISTGKGWLLIVKENNDLTACYAKITSVSISYTLAYTSCGAPTNISFTSVVKPNGSLTISWSGATAGTGNSINGYDVYYKIGSAPTTSSYDGTASVSSTSTSASKTFTISNTATRGAVFYAMVRTKGSAGSSYYSGWKNGNGGKVNSLPGAPIVSVDKTRIKSTGTTTVTFTVTAGSDVDTSQTKTLYYATSASGTKTSFTSPKSFDLTNAATYYFWTYDGLEYSSSYTSKSITKNIPPTIGSITMSAYNGTTYEPSITVSGVKRSYVKNINGSASNVTGNNVTYQWKLCVGSSSTATSYGIVTNISTSTSLSNIDVTSYGADFNTAYKLRLVVTDDLGESATKDSSNVFVIPAAPTISSIINQRDISNVTNTNPSHFNMGMRFYYSPSNMNGITRELQYSTNSNFSSFNTISITSFNTISITGQTYSDATLSSLTRGTTYYFRIKFTCNTKTAFTSVTTGYMRANDITPNITSITSPSSPISPYKDSTLNTSFTNQPTSWVSAQDVPTSYTSIYTAKILYGGREQSINISSASNSSGTVTMGLNLEAITTAQWKTLIGTSTAPNASYTLTLSITAKNAFASTFTSTKTFTVNFLEGIKEKGTLTVSIKTGTSTYTNIPTNTYTSSNRYKLFPTETLRFTLTGMQCYADQKVTLEIRKDSSTGTILVTKTVAASEFSDADSAHLVTLNAQTLDYILPSNLFTTANDINFYLKITLENKSTNSELFNNQCYLIRFVPSDINPIISNIEKSGTTYNITYSYNFTTSGSYTLTGQAQGANHINDTYSNIGSTFNMITSPTSTLANDGSSLLTEDILYFKIKATLVPGYVAIGSATPLGTSSYILESQSVYIFYNTTPNLLYGKNFFVLNANLPKMSGNEETEDQLLVIRSASYKKNNVNKIRNKIYLGNDGSEGILELTTDGLVIDGGSW